MDTRLRGHGHRPAEPHAFHAISQGDCAAIVLDCPVAGWTTAELLEEVQRTSPDAPVLIRDINVSANEAVRLAHLGAYGFLSTDEDPLILLEQAIEEYRRRDLARLAARVGASTWERSLIGNSREMRQIAQIIRLVGGRRATVLITVLERSSAW